MLVLEIIRVEFRVVLIRECCLEMSLEPMRYCAKAPVTRDERQAVLEPLPESQGDLTRGLFREVGISYRKVSSLCEIIPTNPERVGRVTLRVGIDQTHRVSFMR
jgi:hypothetical protein